MLISSNIDICHSMLSFKSSTLNVCPALNLSKDSNVNKIAGCPSEQVITSAIIQIYYFHLKYIILKFLHLLVYLTKIIRLTCIFVHIFVTQYGTIVFSFKQILVKVQLEDAAGPSFNFMYLIIEHVYLYVTSNIV